MTGPLEPGFADPVHGAGACFRAVLDAMAHPGRLRTAGIETGAPPLGPAAAAVLLTLADHETPVWLDPAAAAAGSWIAFHCGAPIVSDLGSCRFALALSLPDLAIIPAGTHEEPEASATVICQVESLTEGRPFQLSGPGLRVPAPLRVTGLPRAFAAIWASNHALFPRGIDLILCAGGTLTALPRTTAITEV